MKARKTELFERDPFANSLGIKIIEVEAGHAVLEMAITESHLNFLGAAHGGALFALADMAFGVASNTEDTVRVGVDAHMAYIEKVELADRLSAHAYKVSENRRTAVYRVDIKRDQDDIASFTGTVCITNRAFGTD